MRRPRLKMALVLLFVLVVQTSVLSSLRIAGVAPDAMLLVAIAGGIAGGASRGAAVGFASGLALDMFLQTPLGLSALTFSLVGYTVGSVQSGILRAAWWIPVATVLVASAAGETLFALSGAVVGQAQLVTGQLFLIVGVVAVLNAVLTPFVLRLVSWGLRPAHALR